MTALETLTAEWELIRLNNEFVYYIDAGDFESRIGLFTPDATFDRTGNVHHGHEELREGMRERPKATTRHLLSNFHFTDIKADSAQGVVCSMVYHGPRMAVRSCTPPKTAGSSSSMTNTPRPRMAGGSALGSPGRYSLPKCGRDRNI